MSWAYTTKAFADLEFVVEQTRLHAHKAIVICYSDYFKALLVGQFKESGTRSILVTDCSAEIFRMVLEFIYTRNIAGGLSGDNVLLLLKAANIFGISFLKEHIEDLLISSMNEENASFLLQVADTEDVWKLKRIARDYILNFSKNSNNSIQKVIGYEDLSAELKNELRK